MRSKILLLISLMALFTVKVYGEEQNETESAQERIINKEAENENFIHAYLLLIREGRPCYTTAGHAAIRLVCPSKSLDYCFTFEMDMQKSSFWDAMRRKAKAGFTFVPSNVFIKQYQKEGRGITSYELNLRPQEKQNLWKVLDSECAKGASWTFDYTSVNCLSMSLYAINEAIEPAEIKFKKLPRVVYEPLGEWIDYNTYQSPWVRIAMHAILYNVEDKQTRPEDLLSPDMMKAVIPYTVISEDGGKYRFLAKDEPQDITQQTYKDKPLWLPPSKVGIICISIIAICFIIIIYKKKREFIQ